ncbi:MAG: pilus assembly protein N-terminal domain-containing protein [Candidatus Caenarcaniphilales bacterium]|nr:pilus assembly protein N-terminal domain-containing protein [Candidatus Caenarcaniphilales bacterium]
MKNKYATSSAMKNFWMNMNKEKNEISSLTFLISVFLLALTLLLPMQEVNAANFGLGAKVPISQNLEVSVGQSTLIKLPSKPERIALSNPGIAYVLMITPDEVEIIGRNPGRTNLYVWFPPAENAKVGTPSKIIGTEISVGLPKPPYITSTPTMEILNGEFSELIYLGNPSEKIRNSRPARVSGPSTDMPEPCLSPGCI